MATAAMTRMPTAKFCQSTSTREDEAVARNADDQRTEQRAEDLPATAEEAGAADDDSGDGVEVVRPPACGLADAIRPMRTHAPIA